MSRGCKLTTDEYKKQISNKSLSVLEEYIDSKTKIKHQCKVCSHIWNVSPNSVKNKKGCPSCAGKMVPTTEQYKEQIKDRNIVVLEEYKGGHTKIKHQCKKCNHIWSVTPGSIKRKSGCPSCVDLMVPTTEQYKEQIKDRNIVVLEEYKDARTKIKHQCEVCNHIWKVTSHSVKSGTGCPVCSANKTAYETYKDVPTWIYYIKIPSKNLYKTGVSMVRNGGTKGRYKRESFEIEIIQEKLFEDGYEAYKLEQKIIQANKHLAWFPSEEEKFGGWTECFAIDLKNHAFGGSWL